MWKEVINMVVEYAIASTIFYFVFFFNTPYWTGQEMAELSKSGIWRAMYRFLAGIGSALFAFSEKPHLVQKACSAFTSAPQFWQNSLVFTSAPHPVQNLSPGTITLPQFVQNLLLLTWQPPMSCLPM